MKLKIFWFAIGLLALFYTYELYDKGTGRFRIEYITGQLPYHPDWEVKAEDQLIGSILKQPFHYLGKGGRLTLL